MRYTGYMVDDCEGVLTCVLFIGPTRVEGGFHRLSQL